MYGEKRKLFAKVAHKVDEYSCTPAATRTGKVVQTRMVTWSVKVDEEKVSGRIDLIDIINGAFNVPFSVHLRQH